MKGRIDAFADRSLGYLSRLLMLVSVGLMALMALHVLADICSRLIFRQSLEATTEIVSYYYMVGIIFLPLLCVRRSESFIIAEIFSKFMSPRMIRVLDAMFDIVLGLWFFLFAYVTMNIALDKTGAEEFVETTTEILTVWPARWFLPIGTGAAGLYCLLEGCRMFAGRGYYDTGASESHEDKNDVST